MAQEITIQRKKYCLPLDAEAFTPSSWGSFWNILYSALIGAGLSLGTLPMLTQAKIITVSTKVNIIAALVLGIAFGALAFLKYRSRCNKIKSLVTHINKENNPESNIPDNVTPPPHPLPFKDKANQLGSFVAGLIFGLEFFYFGASVAHYDVTSHTFIIEIVCVSIVIGLCAMYLSGWHHGTYRKNKYDLHRAQEHLKRIQFANDVLQAEEEKQDEAINLKLSAYEEEKQDEAINLKLSAYKTQDYRPSTWGSRINIAYKALIGSGLILGTLPTLTQAGFLTVPINITIALAVAFGVIFGYTAYKVRKHRCEKIDTLVEAINTANDHFKESTNTIQQRIQTAMANRSQPASPELPSEDFKSFMLGTLFGLEFFYFGGALAKYDVYSHTFLLEIAGVSIIIGLVAMALSGAHHKAYERSKQTLRTDCAAAQMKAFAAEAIAAKAPPLTQRAANEAAASPATEGGRAAPTQRTPHAQHSKQRPTTQPSPAQPLILN